jgi:hypothetical protein
MAYVSLIGACGSPFTSNPDYVLSLRLADGRQLIFLLPCVEAANPERQQRGLSPIVVDPLAYEAQEV